MSFLKQLDSVERFIFGTIAFVILTAIAALTWVATQPSCEDRGGHTIITGYVPMTQLVGKIAVTSINPVYECVGVRVTTTN